MNRAEVEKLNEENLKDFIAKNEGMIAVADHVSRGGVGHNNPPDPIDTINAAFEEIRMEAENWADGTPVENEAQMNAVDALRKGARQWRLDLEAGQKSATAPMYDTYKAELERWKPTITDAKRLEDCLVALVGGFKQKLAAEKEVARKAAWEAAEVARKEAEAKVAAAGAANIEAQREAQAALDAAADARAKASEAQKDIVRGMRKVTRYEVTDHRALLHFIAKNDRDAITAFVDEWARKNHKENRAADGLRVWETSEAY